MDGAKGLIKALENWAKRVTTGYKDVDVRDMSSSFRDGLAFCAIVHHYRPDLIDFESLSKENILENNSLAFSVAEKQLGVPALLDAEDMVKYSRPDRLSIITYLSQLRNCFENQNKVGSVRSSVKRVKAQSSGPPQKIPMTNPQLLPIKRHETCQVCKHRVFILERLIVDGKLYHTACFRCCKCNCLLNPGAYVESDTPGSYECSVCLPDENTDPTDIADPEISPEHVKENGKQASSPPVLRQKSQNEIHLKQSPLSESVTRARSSFLNHSLSIQNKSNGTSSVSEKTSPTIDTLKNSQEDKNSYVTSVKDKISVFEANEVSKPRTSINRISSPTSDLNFKAFDVHQQAPLLKTSREELSPLNMASKSEHSNRSLSTLCSSTEKNEITDDEKLVSPKSVFPQTSDTIKNESENVNNAQFTTKQSYSLGISESKSEINIGSVSQTPHDKKSAFDLNVSSDTKDLSSNKFQFSRQQTLVNDYKSPIRKPRDIFQTNIQPLKLSIPSVNSTVKREPSSLPITPSFVSPTSTKNLELPQIRSIYSVTLPRQNSFTSVDVKENSKADSLGNRMELRRKSLESNNNGKISSKESFSIASVATENKDFSGVNSGKGIKQFSEKVSVDSDTVPDSSFPKSEESNNLNSFLKQMENVKQNAHLPSPDKKFTPIPTIRHSLDLEAKRQCSSNLDSFKNKLQSVSYENFSSSFEDTEKCLQTPSIENDDMSCFSGAQNSSILNKSSESVLSENTATVTEETQDYPDDLNPFGSDDENKVVEYPDDLNPFGDDDGPVEPAIVADNYDESKNPFASDDDDDDNESSTFPNNNSMCSQRSAFSSDVYSLQQNGSCSSFSSPNGSLKGTVKKRQAPKPPMLNEIFQNDSLDSEVSYSSTMSPSTAKKSLQTPSPKLRKNKPAPPPPPTAKQISQTDLTADSKHMKEIDNMKLKTSTPDANDDSKKSPKQYKKKKRPAPPVPIPMRRDMKKIPLKEILREMKEIEEKQREYEKQGREIELLIRDRDKDEEASVEEEEYIMQLFELVNQKNALFRRQAELMYIKRSQRLEEQQYEIEKQIRLLMAKPESEKTDEDREKEQELTMELIDIVDQRNSIIDSIEMDRRRELEEDVSVQEQLEMKNGDLPITAELKEKSKGKVKKSKNKKDKKKHNESGSSDSGKGTLKKKKWHLSSKAS